MPEESPEQPPTDETAPEPASNPAEEAVASVEEAAAAVQAAVDDIGQEEPLRPEVFEDDGDVVEASAARITLLRDVSLRVKIELGRTHMYVQDVLRLNNNSVIELDKAAGDHVDIYVNDRHIARGEVLVLNENFCVRVSEIVESPG